jgi:hypothetical protein
MKRNGKRRIGYIVHLSQTKPRNPREMKERRGRIVCRCVAETTFSRNEPAVQPRQLPDCAEWSAECYNGRMKSVLYNIIGKENAVE